MILTMSIVIHKYIIQCSSIEIDDIFCKILSHKDEIVWFTVDNINSIVFAHNDMEICNDDQCFTSTTNIFDFNEFVGKYKAAIRTLRGIGKADPVKTLEARVDALEEREFERF
jgi:DNA helicase IV